MIIIPILFGMLFITLGLISYIKTLKNVVYLYDITKISNIKNIAIIVFMVVFIALYIFISFNISFVVSSHKTLSQAISWLLCFGGIFVYLVVIVLGKAFYSIENFHLEMVKGLVGVFELRDKFTKGHSEHVAHIAELLYEKLPRETKKNIIKHQLIMAALLHDIGKILVPEEILNKRGSLTNEEYKKIKGHANYSEQILRSFNLFSPLANIVKYHHERLDGRGYNHLLSDEIPIESKIISVADTYSALSMDRIYRKKEDSKKKTIATLEECKGDQLDPLLVDILIGLIRLNKI